MRKGAERNLASGGKYRGGRDCRPSPRRTLPKRRHWRPWLAAELVLPGPAFAVDVEPPATRPALPVVEPAPVRMYRLLKSAGLC